MKYANNDEYDGKWEVNRPLEGVFLKVSSGRIERRLYEKNEVREVLEVI